MISQERIKQINQINQWYKNYEQVSQQWQEWLSVNFDRYHSAEAAWIAFNETQQLETSLTRNSVSLFQ